METCLVHKTDFGLFAIVEDGSALIRLDLANRTNLTTLRLCETPLLTEAARQLDEYLDGKRKAFDLPLAPQGTPFQRAVWTALQAIPYGETRGYAQIAAAVGRPKAARAVGGANHANPIMIIIPCHRVIGADGSLVGFGGGLELKQKLLELERAVR